MSDHQKTLYLSLIVILSLVAGVESFFLLRNSDFGRQMTASLSRKAHPVSDAATTGEVSAAETAPETEEMVVQETADDLDRIHEQINRLLREMFAGGPFGMPWGGAVRREDRMGRLMFSPPEDMLRLQDEIGRIFSRARDGRHSAALNFLQQSWDDVRATSPMNLDESGTNYVVTLSIPGFEKSGINITLSGRVLSVSATSSQPQGRGMYSNSFKTQVLLPEDVQGEACRACYRDGVLTISIPRAPGINSLARNVTIM